MNLKHLTDKIIAVHNELQGRAKSAINMLLTIRNWLIGYYIVEYEQNGSDKARYGDKLLVRLSNALKRKGLSNVSDGELRRFRIFYNTYPRFSELFANPDNDQIRGTLSHILDNPVIRGTLSHELTARLSRERLQKSQVTGKQPLPQKESPSRLSVPPTELITHLSFSHVVELIKIKDNLKRTFYEVECIKGTWSVRELKRQINSLFYERSGLSANKEKLSQLANTKAETENTALSLRDPMVFEFLYLPINETLEEAQLERALIDHLQQFLLELGYGFCFEARQKRILIDDEYYYIDLVFYHRILKCHVLIELKTEGFTHENIGQLNVYLQYYKEKVMQEGDNPPIGILLCTESKPQMVRYALADKDNVLVSRYKLQLPSEDELQQFIEEQLSKNF